jgi:secreted Zn-dependent insulinase-like peptidase
MNEDSTLNNFITGSKEILDKPNIRDILINFYNKYYNPKNISICITSSKSIDDLKKIICDTFGNIECKENIIKISESSTYFFIDP